MATVTIPGWVSGLGTAFRRIHPKAFLLGGAFGVLFGWGSLTLVVVSGQTIQTGGYQMVYLTNGQAIFGKLQNTSGSYLVIKEPFTLQAAAGASEEDSANATSILKMTDQVYGPEDSISVRSDNVISWQNLRPDSKVTQAIEKRQNQ